MSEREDRYTISEILEALDICGETMQKRGCSECPFFREEDVYAKCRITLINTAASLIRELLYDW